MSVVDAAPPGPDATATGPSGAATPARRRRWWSLPGVWFPLGVFAVWRVAQGTVMWWLGGRLTEIAYT
jgi:hypothetical protein